MSMRRTVSAILLVIAASVCGGSPTTASVPQSVYTTIELRTCRQTGRHHDGGAWLCPGLPGYPVYVAEGDLRFFVSFGADAGKRLAASQTLGPFNTIFSADGRRSTLEWRLKGGRAGKPHATILRYYTDRGDGGGKGQVLVVSKVTPTESCHMAYVDARANRDAIALARSAADELALVFKCGTQPRIVGVSGISPM